MALVLENTAVSPGVYKMTVEFTGDVKPGQFFMLRAWDKDPLLSRPISVHDYEASALCFLYQVVGRGTEILSKRHAGTTVNIQGPYGNGFPKMTGDLCLVGGGIGVAPLYYLLKNHRKENPTCCCRVYLGFRDQSYGVEGFERLADALVTDIGGIITQKLSFSQGETVVTCGPEVMMKAVAQVTPESHTVYVSLESRMACGLGACLGCVCETKTGNQKICKDGPVFERNEVFYV